MSDFEGRADELLRSYVAASEEAGQPVSPVPFLDRASAAELPELQALIDSYLDSAAHREWDAEAFHGSGAERVFERLDRSLSGRSGEWPVLLARLRHQQQLTRTALVGKLAAELGGADEVDAGMSEADRERIASYYHEMESGLLDSEGVTDKVLDSLGRILGCGRELLRQAGRPFGEGGAAGSGLVFARISDGEQPPLISDEALPDPDPGSWDEIDTLFRGRGRQ